MAPPSPRHQFSGHDWAIQITPPTHGNPSEWLREAADGPSSESMSAPWGQAVGFAYAATPVSYMMQGSSPTVQASCPGSRRKTSPAATVASTPSLVRIVILPDTQMPVCRTMHDSVPAMGLTSFDHCQPGSKVPRPSVKSPSVTTSIWPCAAYGRVSLGSSMLRSSTVCLLCRKSDPLSDDLTIRASALEGSQFIDLAHSGPLMRGVGRTSRTDGRSAGSRYRTSRRPARCGGICSAGITVPTASESGSTRPCGRHHSTLAVAKNVWTGSPTVGASSTRSSMTITVPPSARAALACAIAVTGWAMSCTHSKNTTRS